MDASEKDFLMFTDGIPQLCSSRQSPDEEVCISLYRKADMPNITRIWRQELVVEDCEGKEGGFRVPFREEAS